MLMSQVLLLHVGSFPWERKSWVGNQPASKQVLASLQDRLGWPPGQAGVAISASQGELSPLFLGLSFPSHQILMEQHLSPSTTPLLLSPFLVWAALAWQSLPAPLLLQNLEEKHELTQE